MQLQVQMRELKDGNMVTAAAQAEAESKAAVSPLLCTSRLFPQDNVIISWPPLDPITSQVKFRKLSAIGPEKA